MKVAYPTSTYTHLHEVGPASSSGPDWRSQGTNVGTDAVVFPDPKASADSFRQNLGRRITAKDRDEWEEYCRRSGVSEVGVEQGWHALFHADERSRAIETLAKVFGESAGNTWGGFWIPLKQMTELPPEEDPKPEARLTIAKPSAKKVRKAHMSGNVGKATEAVLVLDKSGSTDLAAGQGYAFTTKSAEAVYSVIQKLILLYPLSGPADILNKAIHKSGVDSAELSPEDMQLLKMAIEYLQNGPVKNDVRTGGLQGGPARDHDGAFTW